MKIIIAPLKTKFQDTVPINTGLTVLVFFVFKYLVYQVFILRLQAFSRHEFFQCLTLLGRLFIMFFLKQQSCTELLQSVAAKSNPISGRVDHGP